jgi:hypothetical protein
MDMDKDKDPLDMTNRELAREMRLPETSWRYHHAQAEMERRRMRLMFASAIAAMVSAVVAAVSATASVIAALAIYFRG